MFECVVSGCRQRAMVAVCRLKSRLKDVEWCVTYTDVCAMRGDQVTAWHSPCGICFVMFFKSQSFSSSLLFEEQFQFTKRLEEWIVKSCLSLTTALCSSVLYQ